MKKFLLPTLLILLIASASHAIPTKLIVRARAHDAKFIGSAVGGVAVTVRDAFTGKILATGSIEGGTGNTKILMLEPIKRGTLLSQGGAAKAEFVFDIDKPVKLQIEVEGPLGAGLNVHKEVKTVWLIPGEDIDGDGVIFTLYGLIVHSYSPSPHQFYTLGQKVLIGAHVTPLCGCPVSPGCIWDARDIDVKAYIYKNGKLIAKLPLKWSGKISSFEAEFTPPGKGGYKVFITAASKDGNQGVAVTGFVVVPEKMYKMILNRLKK